MPNLDLVISPIDAPQALDFAQWVADQCRNPEHGADLPAITKKLADVLPNLQHVAGEARLDDRV